MEIKEKIIKVLKNPYIIVPFLGDRGRLKWLPDELYLKFSFKAKLNQSLDLEKPKTFNEKLQWLKLNDRKPIYTQFVDKYEVRSFISEKIGEEYLIPLIGVWEKFEDIDFDSLPNEFVLKCTHDSASVIICDDKKKFDKEKAKSKIEKSLKSNYYYAAREWPYKNVKPRIIAEKYMVDNLGGDLKDYKYMCFNGQVKCCFVCSNRNSKDGLNIDIYDKEWKLMEFTRPGHGNSNIIIEKPNNYKLMIELAEKLSKDIPFIRVDFYEINNRVYFGELTFFPAAGFEKFTPEEYDHILGEWINLPNNNDISSL